MPLAWPDLEFPPINLWNAPRMQENMTYCNNYNCPNADICARSLDYEYNDSNEFNIKKYEYYVSENMVLCEGFLQVFDGK